MRLSLTALIFLSLSVAGCGNVQLPNGFEIREADRGKTWVVYPDGKQIIADVTGVWVSGDELIVETSPGNNAPPDQSCSYVSIDTRTSISPEISQQRAREMVGGGSYRQRTLTSGSCLRQQGIG